MASSTVRFAILGTSGHALRVALPALRSVEQATVLGAVGSSLERSNAFARDAGLPRTYADIDAMLADREVDAVWICTPNHLHAEQVGQCAAAGKHVLVEKPLAVGRVAAERAAEAAERAGVVLRIGCQHRFRPAHARLRELIRAGSIGELGYLRIHRFWRYPYFEDMAAAAPPAWRRSAAESGGWVINDIGAHLLDLALWLTDMPASVAGAVLASQHFDVGTEDSAAVLLTLGASAIGSIEASCANDSPGSRIELYGSNGWVRADDTLSGRTTLTRQGGGSESFEPFAALDAYRANVADFIAATRGQPGIGADGAAGVAVAALIETALQRGVVAQRKAPSADEARHERSQ
jgi:1,5-anhydro-D-fructose reductase (1,5-anhydro-D-mannitol-forming)